MDYPEIDEEIATLAAARVIRMVEAGALPSSAGRCPDAVMVGITLGLAMIIEQAPQCRTKRGLQKISEGFGKMLVERAEQFRAMFEAMGVHLIMRIQEHVTLGSAKPN